MRLLYPALTLLVMLSTCAQAAEYRFGSAADGSRADAGKPAAPIADTKNSRFRIGPGESHFKAGSQGGRMAVAFGKAASFDKEPAAAALADSVKPDDKHQVDYVSNQAPERNQTLGTPQLMPAIVFAARHVCSNSFGPGSRSSARHAHAIWRRCQARVRLQGVFRECREARPKL